MEQNFVTLRKKAGLKQYELAEKIGVSVVTLRKYEQGITFPKPYTLHRLSVALSVNIEILYNIGFPGAKCPVSF